MELVVSTEVVSDVEREPEMLWLLDSDIVDDAVILKICILCESPCEDELGEGIAAVVEFSFPGGMEWRLVAAAEAEDAVLERFTAIVEF
jgi:hypothetical protein